MKRRIVGMILVFVFPLVAVGVSIAGLVYASSDPFGTVGDVADGVALANLFVSGIVAGVGGALLAAELPQTRTRTIAVCGATVFGLGFYSAVARTVTAFFPWL